MFRLILLCVALAFTAVTSAEEPHASNSDDLMAIYRVGADQKEATNLAPGIFQATGFGNTFMVVTNEGNVIIDTSLPMHAPRAKKLLTAQSDGPIKYIILTHGHSDHTGGIDLWKEEGTEIIAQKNFVEFQNYQHRLDGMFARRNAAQFPALAGRPMPDIDKLSNYGAKIEPTILVDDKYSFTLGELTFDIYSAPGETYDHLFVHIPERRILFSGDNFYQSFPNIYSLRGTKPRWALDYIESLNKISDIRPAVLAPSHGEAMFGSATIMFAINKYRDAIQYVHDATVRGMNEGKDVYTLMREIELPEWCDVGEGYGKVAWSVRGIYEGYMGWFDGNPANMYPLSAEEAYSELLELAGGPTAVVKRSRALMDNGDDLKALRLTDMVLAIEPKNREALEARVSALGHLRAKSTNVLETGWLLHGIDEAQKTLDLLDETEL